MKVHTFVLVICLVSISYGKGMETITHDGLDGFEAGRHFLQSDINTIDISDDTNLAATAPIILTGDTLSLDYESTDFNLVGTTLTITNSGIDHDALTNFLAAKHYDWTSETHDVNTTGSGRFDGGIGVGVAPVAGRVYADYLFAAYGILASNDGVPDGVAGMSLFYDDSMFGSCLMPNIDDTFDLGAASYEWKDLRIDGLAYIDELGEDLDCGGFDLSNIGTGTFTNLVLPNNSEIQDSATGYLILSGDGAIWSTGLSISIPQVAEDNFYYGYGGIEHHFFGASGQVEISDDGNITVAGTVQAEQLTSTDDITMQGHALNLGDVTAATDTVINLYGSTNSATITYDESTKELDWGDVAFSNMRAILLGDSQFIGFGDDFDFTFSYTGGRGDFFSLWKGLGITELIRFLANGDIDFQDANMVTDGTLDVNSTIRTAADQDWNLGTASAQADFAGDTKIRVTIDSNDYDIVALAVP